MTKSRNRSRIRSRSRSRSTQLRGGTPAITYPLALMVGLGVLYYLKKQAGQLGERLEAKGDRAIEEAQANVAALARRAGDDLIKRDREKLRLKISRLNRELDLEDRIDDADKRAWNCDFAGDPIFCLNEIIQELENIGLAAEERKRLKREQEFKSDLLAADIDKSIVQDILKRKKDIEEGASPSDERSPFMEAAVQAAEANRTKLSRKTRLKNKLTPQTRIGGRTIRKRNRRGRTRRITRTRTSRR